ncbi:MAG: hypothetical protein LBS19_02935, partial [Clostridiales bacterium]|nr:hypothetical protein [Clostridiales bacterium]
QKRRDNSSYKPLRLLVLEEWTSYISMLQASGKEGQQTAKEVLAMAFALTSKGRAYNTHCLFSVQKPSMEFFQGFRENLVCVVGLGRISPRSRTYGRI